jgi:FMN reductase [NAD(P)H]
VDFRDVLRQRRMVRSYRPDPVSHDVLERIVATVRRAPSGGFSQGQRLLVVTDAATRAEIARLAGEEESRAQGFEPWISEAPAHVVVCTREEDYHERYRRPDKLRDGDEIAWAVPYWYVDAGAALMRSCSPRSTRGSPPASSGCSTSRSSR